MPRGPAHGAGQRTPPATKPNRHVSFRSILLKAWFSQRERAIDRFRRRPAETQERVFRQLLRRGRRTEFGWRYDLGHVRTVEQFQTMVETFDYETFKPYIEKIARFVKERTGGLDVVYGGGLKADNAAMLASIADIDGGLIALTRFSGEIGFYPEEYLEIIRLYLGH